MSSPDMEYRGSAIGKGMCQFCKHDLPLYIFEDPRGGELVGCQACASVELRNATKPAAAPVENNLPPFVSAGIVCMALLQNWVDRQLHRPPPEVKVVIHRTSFKIYIGDVVVWDNAFSDTDEMLKSCKMLYERELRSRYDSAFPKDED